MQRRQREGSEEARLDEERINSKFICYRLQVYDEDFMCSTCKQIVCDLSISEMIAASAFLLLYLTFMTLFVFRFSFIALINCLNLIWQKHLNWGGDEAA